MFNSLKILSKSLIFKFTRLSVILSAERIAIKGEATKNLKHKKLCSSVGWFSEKPRYFRNLTLKLLVKIGGLITYIPPLIFWREEIRKRMYRFVGSDYLKAGALKKTFLGLFLET